MDHHLLTLNEAREATNLKIWKKLMESQEQTTLVKRMPASFPDQIERGSRDSRRLVSKLIVPRHDYGDTRGSNLLGNINYEPSVKTNIPDDQTSSKIHDSTSDGLPGLITDPAPPPDDATSVKITCIDQTVEQSFALNFLKDSKFTRQMEGEVLFFHKPNSVRCRESDSNESLETIYLDDNGKKKKSSNGPSSQPSGRLTVLNTAIPKRKPLLVKRLLKHRNLQQSNSVIIKKQSHKQEKSCIGNYASVGERSVESDNENIGTDKLNTENTEDRITPAMRGSLTKDSENVQRLDDSTSQETGKEIENTETTPVKDDNEKNAGINLNSKVAEVRDLELSVEGQKDKKSGLIVVKEAEEENRVSDEKLLKPNCLILRESSMRNIARRKTQEKSS
ncbi:hypothetical protein BSL78_06141 [Apostichopus japonicus]|uniref:Uncharacterized protein n=1 Tax=Stichopus japonicus TaxID=307972 RepID=A0A2G8L9W8_STIJA|nr:hypothetical protein BSL78_06141 [Apostichopus japonicus]